MSDPLVCPTDAIGKFKCHLRNEHRMKHALDYALMCKFGTVTLLSEELWTIPLCEHVSMLLGELGFGGREINKVKVVDSTTGEIEEFE